MAEEGDGGFVGRQSDLRKQGDARRQTRHTGEREHRKRRGAAMCDAHPLVMLAGRRIGRRGRGACGDFGAEDIGGIERGGRRGAREEGLQDKRIDRQGR